MTDSEQRWIARLTPSAGITVEALLGMPLGLDVWERHPGYLVVAAPDSALAECERRRLAKVDRWATQEQYEAQMANRPTTGNEG